MRSPKRLVLIALSFLLSVGILLALAILQQESNSILDPEWMKKALCSFPNALCSSSSSSVSILGSSTAKTATEALVVKSTLKSSSKIFVKPTSFQTVSIPSSIITRPLSTASTTTTTTAMTATSTNNITLPQENKNGESKGSLVGDSLLSLREMFLDDIKAGKANGWTIVMGNEAGDLDSLACALTYAFLSTTLLAKPKHIALVQTPRAELSLRPENTLVLANVSIESSSLLCVDDLPIEPAELVRQGVKLALVDHNRVTSKWIPELGSSIPTGTEGSVEIEAVVDHHADEGLYKEADPRIVNTGAGSCSSLVALYFQSVLPSPSGSSSPSSMSTVGLGGQPLIPKELATLLLSAILIDTSGLKENGKATDRDWKAVEYLYPYSHLNPDDLAKTGHDLSILESDPDSSSDENEGSVKLLPDLLAWSALLSTTKKNVSHFSTEDLLARDYKQYSFRSPILPISKEITLGLASVPLGLDSWLTRSNPRTPWSSVLQSLESFATTHQLDLLGVMTTFKSKNKTKVKGGESGGKEKSKSRRELLLFAPTTEGGLELVWEDLVSRLEQEDVLDLQPWKAVANAEEGEGAGKVWGKKEATGRIWKQGNAGATRKTMAPVMKAILEGTT
ncbi:Exopolyphosphatases and related proteins [Phaffia rhodozyma]|uniref:Exopolyphosphatases and related proteins n=1 Tax=Phaffia rhodozyma TaxID=264483 RepID=A0A0F7SY43_PHARH|nr:Exopolyphosphatases and related proteins [Phaffia rhodozyma]